MSAPGEVGQGRLEAFALLRLCVLAAVAFAAVHGGVAGQRHIRAAAGGEGLAGGEVAGQGGLAGVQIDGPDAVAVAQQADDEVHRRGGFAGAALLVAEGDDIGAAGNGNLSHQRPVRMRSTSWRTVGMKPLP